MSADTLQLLTLAEFDRRPAMTWLVRDVIPDQALVVVFGQPKGGKTFSITDLLLHAAHGLPWHGHKIQRPLRIAFLAGEGRSGLRVRIHAWLEYHDSVELCGDFRLLPESLSLPDRVDDVIELLASYKPDVVAVDTLNAYFGPGDENSTQDMTRFVTALRYVRDSLACAVVTLHHTGLADRGRERGSSVLRAAADVVIQVGKDEGGTGEIGFQVVTARDSEDWPNPLSLKLRRVDTDWTDDDGYPMTTCVVDSGRNPVTLSGRGQKLSEAQRLTCDAVSELAARKANGGGPVLIARADVVKAVVDRGGKRASAYRNLEQLKDRMGWKFLEPGAIEVFPQ